MNVPIPIERIASPSRETIERAIARRRVPFIVTDVVTQWRAFSTWSLAYLRDRVGDKDVAVGISSNNMFHYGSPDVPAFRTARMSFRDAVQRLLSPAAGSMERLYIMEQSSTAGPRSLGEVYPELAEDYTVPAGVEADKLTQVNLWIGGSGNITPLHFDMGSNFLAQVVGRKRINLFAPPQTDLLYPNGSRRGFNNTSQVDILRPDFGKHPRFRDAAASVCVLNAGEMLYIPPFWWHQVESLDNAVSINFWWTPRFTHCLHPMGLRLIYLLHDQGKMAQLAASVLEEFANFAQAAAYCLERGHKCVAVLLAKAELDVRCGHQQARIAAALAPWGDLLAKAEKEDDGKLDYPRVVEFLKSLGAAPEPA